MQCNVLGDAHLRILLLHIRSGGSSSSSITTTTTTVHFADDNNGSVASIRVGQHPTLNGTSLHHTAIHMCAPDGDVLVHLMYPFPNIRTYVAAAARGIKGFLN